MSNYIVLKRGLNLPIKGEADLKVSQAINPDIIAIKPTDFKGFVPRLLVHEGDNVLAGSPVLASKTCSDILFTSPISGTVTEIIRGEKRKLLEVRIKANPEQEYVDFGVCNVEELDEKQIKEKLLNSGLWPCLIQRPYGIIANPQITPRDIYISGFNTAPLAANLEYTLNGQLEYIQIAVNALCKLTSGKVHLNIDGSIASIFEKINNVKIHSFVGKHPAGNVGIQISHLNPIKKEETVWTINPTMLVAIGKLFKTGKYDLKRKVAITGPKAINPSYVETLPGMSIKSISQYFDDSNEELRFVSGDVLTGTNVGKEGFTGFFDNQITILKEGREREVLGWAKPARTNLFSFSRSYFSWLLPKKKYDMNTNLHGGPRAFLMSDVYSKVLPMDIFPIYLVKACIAGNIDNMEKYGIYEVLPEDLALCEFVDPSKNEIQKIISDGLDKMYKEMA